MFKRENTVKDQLHSYNLDNGMKRVGFKKIEEYKTLAERRREWERNNQMLIADVDNEGEVL